MFKEKIEFSLVFLGSLITRRVCSPRQVLLPGKSHGQRSLVGCSPWGHWGSDFTFTFHFHALEKEMATHSSVLAWRIPGTGEPGGLPSVGSHRVWHDWSNLAAACSPNGTLPKFPKQCSFQEATDSDISSQCRVSGKFTVLFCLRGTY